ncbi:MAG: zinc ribbon domain-containing protein, partial [Microbacteriaceae bacterium]
KGMLQCGHCRDAGRTSRLVYSQINGNGGTYEYLVCAAKQRKQCSMPWIRVEQIEERIFPAVAAERLNADALDGMRSLVTGAVQNLLAEDRDAKTQLRKELNKLEAQEERLIELAATGSLPIAKIRQRIEHTTLQKEAVKEKLELTIERLQYGSETALAYIDLLANPGQLYTNASDTVRRDLLSAYFEHLIVYVRDENLQVDVERNQANLKLRELHGAHQFVKAQLAGPETKIPARKRGF